MNLEASRSEDGALVASKIIPVRAWGGYLNGQIPTSVLTRVTASAGEPYLHTDAAAAYEDLSAAFATTFGSALPITEAYRDLTRQQALYDAYINGTGSLAALPGTSIHGWALACDFGGGVETSGSTQKAWMNAQAPAYGWHPTGDNFTQAEPWHFEFEGDGIPDDNNDKEEDMIRLAHIPSTDSTQPDLYIVIDHGQHTYWHVETTSMLTLLRAQGIREITDRQDRDIISGYHEIE